MEKLRLLNEDVLVKAVYKNEFENSPIHVVEQGDHKDNSINFFEVLQVADGVTEVEVGDLILLELGAHTIPFQLEDARCAITDVNKIIGVVDDE